MNLGLPYMGSKNRIAQKLLDVMPSGSVFVDLFCGGCAVTHAAIISGKYKRFICNDIDGAIPRLFLDCINGKYKDENRWISREDFERMKNDDAYIRSVWSFGNNGVGYMYSKEVEPWKKALHYARVLGDLSPMREFGIDTDGSSADILAHHDEYKLKYVRWYVENVIGKQFNEKLIRDLKGRIERTSEELRLYLVQARDAAGLSSSDVDRLLGTNGMAGHYFGRSQWEFPTREKYDIMRKAMPSLVDYDEVYGYADLLQSLERLQSLESLEVHSGDYRAVDIPAGAVVYCDIPYRSTSDYVAGTFDHDSFYEWALSRPFPVYVSEYSMPSEFTEVWSVSHRSILSISANNCVTERLFCNRAQARLGQLSFL